MALITCPKCSKNIGRAGFPGWAILLSIVLFPVGLLFLLVGRKPTRCYECGHIFQA